MIFKELKITEPILKAVEDEGYAEPTAIQEQAIPVVLKGMDLIGCAQTGTGKTAAFAIPILQRLAEEEPNEKGRRIIRALILTPTRELAVQIGESFRVYGRYLKLKHAVIYGGVSQTGQTNALKSGVDIMIATPGRLLDLVGQGHIKLQQVKVFVLDEADRMLDMGFSIDVKKIVKLLHAERQTLLFSATMPVEIMEMANTILKDPVKIAVTPVPSTVDTIKQTVYYVEQKRKKELLIHLLKSDEIESALIFTKTKHGADRTARELRRAGIKSDAIHGDKTQNSRQLALNNFKARKTRVLVATDIAARGIDVVELSHVINFDIPNIPETYVHRIGRTGRAGLGGVAISFCGKDERPYLRNIQKLISKSIPIIKDHPFNTPVVPAVGQVSARVKSKPFARFSKGRKKLAIVKAPGA